MITLRRAFLSLVLGVAACATPGQVRQVQTQVMVGQREAERADSARQAEIVRLMAAQQKLVDSIIRVSASLDERLTRLDINTQASIEDARRDISVMTQALNVSTAKMAQIRSDMDARQAAATPGDTTAAAASDDQMYDAANREFNSGRMTTAREAFHDLVTAHPNSQYVPTSLLRIGTTFDPGTPDSARAYYLMVTKLPPSVAVQSAAPTALWKLGQLEELRKNTDGAKVYYQQIVDKYKNSSEYTRALEKIRKP